MFDTATLLFRQTRLTTPEQTSPSLTSSAPLLQFFAATSATLNPRSTWRHGRQEATQTGDSKQLINVVTPLHLPGPTRGGELSAGKTKQPPTKPTTHNSAGEWVIKTITHKMYEYEAQQGGNERQPSSEHRVFFHHSDQISCVLRQLSCRSVLEISENGASLSFLATFQDLEKKQDVGYWDHQRCD